MMRLPWGDQPKAENFRVYLLKGDAEPREEREHNQEGQDERKFRTKRVSLEYAYPGIVRNNFSGRIMRDADHFLMEI
jgi:hypothetical protein